MFELHGTEQFKQLLKHMLQAQWYMSSTQWTCTAAEELSPLSQPKKQLSVWY